MDDDDGRDRGTKRRGDGQHAFGAKRQVSGAAHWGHIVASCVQVSDHCVAQRFARAQQHQHQQPSPVAHQHQHQHQHQTPPVVGAGPGKQAVTGAGVGAGAGATQSALVATSLFDWFSFAYLLPAELQDAFRQTPASTLNNDDFETVWKPKFRAVGVDIAPFLGPHVVRAPRHYVPNSPSLLAAFSFVCHQRRQDQMAAGTPAGTGTPAAGTDSHPDMSGPFEAVCNPT